MIVVQSFFPGAGVIEPVHVVDEMRENNLPVLKLFHPFRLPLQGDKAVIVDRRQGPHHFFYGHSALADEIVGVLIIRIPQMHMFNIGTQILDGSIRSLIEVPVGMMHIPKGTQPVAGKALQHGAQPGSICINAAGLDQQTDPLGLCFLHQNRQILPHQLFPVLQSAGNHIAHPHIPGKAEHGF